MARRRLTLTDCNLLTDWDNNIGLVGFFDDRETFWWLGHRDFLRGQVLNQRIMNSLKFHGYDYMIEGVLLFTGLKPLPEAYQHGMTIPFTLVFLDQNENEMRQGADLSVDRTWEPERKVARPKSSLRSPAEGSATSEPGLGQNINRGKVPDPVPSAPYKRMDRDESGA